MPKIDRADKYEGDHVAFVTGSHAYGAPKGNSDLDMVVLISGEELKKVFEAAGLDEEEERRKLGQWNQLFAGEEARAKEKPDLDYPTAAGIPFRFGRVNLICCTNVKQYEVWRDGTRILQMEAEERGSPMTREEAVALFKDLRERAGLLKEKCNE